MWQLYSVLRQVLAAIAPTGFLPGRKLKGYILEYAFFLPPSYIPKKSIQKSIQKTYLEKGIEYVCLLLLRASFLLILEKKSPSISFNITDLNLLGNDFLDGEAEESYGSLPVSYTHLTLPTICSV